MRRQETLNRINECLARFVAEVKGSAAARFADINKHSEAVLVPLFREVFELPNLRNLNTTERADFPAIDLADDVARVAFQITASPGREKVLDTLKTFLRHNLQARYDRLVIYVLTERQREYSTAGVSDLIAGRMTFSCEKDIIDWREFLKVLAGRSTESLERARDVLEKEFGSGNRSSSGDPLDEPERLPNLVEVYRRRDSYVGLEYTQLERLVRQSLLKDFPLLYWCGKYKGDVLVALESLFIREDFPIRSGACHLWMLLQDHPVEMHVAKMNGLRLGRTLDTVHKIVRESSRPKPAEHYASRGMPPSEIVKLMAHYLGEPAVRELSAFARHPDKIIRRMVAYWLYKQHNFASVDLLITLLEDTDVGVQYEALRSLAHIGTRGGDEFCLHYLLLDDDEDPCVGPVYDDDTLADDAQYRPLFPTGLKSRWAFLHHALTDRLGEERERFVSGRVGVLGVSGQAKDLDLLLSLYVEGLERWPDTVRWEWKRALNLIDERLYQGSAIGVHYRNAPTFIHRWWQHSHEGEGF